MKKTPIKTAVVAIVVAPALVPQVADATCDYSSNWMASACERMTRVADDGTWNLYLTITAGASTAMTTPANSIRIHASAPVERE
jgi:hypothetical protein